MQETEWSSSFKSHIWIFNVGRGLSIFIRTALNQGILYDFGSSDDFKPTEFLKKNILPHLNSYKESKIAQAIISHPHADHISEISENLCNSGDLLYPALITCPHDKIDGGLRPENIDWNRIKNPNGSENTINIYRKLYASRSLPLQTICYDSVHSIPNLEYGLYYVRPPIVDKIFPSNDQEYVNGLSLILFYRHGHHSILIPGDINPEILKLILDEGEGVEKRYTIFNKQKNSENPDWDKKTSNQPSLKSLLKEYGLSVLIAPHHGLESSFSEDLYLSIKGNKPGIVVISEKRHQSETDGKIKPFYQNSEGSIGQSITIEGEMTKRNSVSTRSGHHILILFQGSGGLPEIFLEKDPCNLLRRLK